MNRWSTQHSLPTVGANLAWSILVLGTAGCIGLWSELPDYDYCEDESDCGTDEQCVQGHCVGENNNGENAGEVISNQTGNSNARESNAESNQTGNSGGSNGEFNQTENYEETNSNSNQGENSGQNDGNSNQGENSGQNDGNSEQNDGTSEQNDGNSGQNDGNSGQNGGNSEQNDENSEQNDENSGQNSGSNYEEIEGPPNWVIIELDWDPQDVEPDSENAQGTDLNLNYAPDGVAFGSSDSVFWKNRDSDWGDDGDASLTNDDMWGEEPEVILHQSMETDGRFKIGVHCHCDHGFGPSDATVDIHLGDTLVAQKERVIEGTGHFWYVGDVVVGDTSTFEKVDEYIQDPVGEDFHDLTDCSDF